MAVLVRVARQKDREPILEFVKGIWGGHDYIPRVWDDWLRDRRGRMFVAEVDGKTVAMNRVRFLDDGSGWLEGVRVHPRFRRQGLATMLGKNSMKFAEQKGARVVRLTTGSANRPAHLQIAGMGLREVARMSVYTVGRGQKFRAAKGVRRATPAEATRLLETIGQSKEYEIGGGVYWDGFTATAINRKTLTMRAKEGSVYLAGKTVAIARRGGEGSSAWRQVCFATGPADGVFRVLARIFGGESRREVSWKIVYAPSRSPLVRTLIRAGLRRWGTFLLYEHKVPKS